MKKIILLDFWNYPDTDRYGEAYSVKTITLEEIARRRKKIIKQWKEAGITQ